MILTSGAKLGPYDIVAPLGAGGMGEVYRARDPRLGRDVALKVLPEAFARDVDRMVRFEREAKVLASLNHPYIASIYGVEESNDARALVMELVEGPTLAERIKQGPLAVDEALPVAKQIADGLEYAHERGIIHRDLKPSNVKLTLDGQVRILDFGLAKALEGETSEAELQNSPTLSAAATRSGVLLGTAPYMSPEQARGKRVDRRADIWAFGCVLYEMLTGAPAFGGETTSDVLACVIRAEPDWSSLPGSAPQGIRELLRRCLQKDPKQRLQAIGDARVTIDEVLAGALDLETFAASGDAHLKLRERIAWSVSTAFLAIAAAALGIGYFSRTPEPAQPIISQIEPPKNTDFILTGLSAGPPVLSPQGNRLAFVARSADGKQFLFRRPRRQVVPPGRKSEARAGAPIKLEYPDARRVRPRDFGDSKLAAIRRNPREAVNVNCSCLCQLPAGAVEPQKPGLAERSTGVDQNPILRNREIPSRHCAIHGVVPSQRHGVTR
jgi:eukaryotic-like serine/threonine-protein kinase